jgi:hypothetical protein
MVCCFIMDGDNFGFILIYLTRSPEELHIAPQINYLLLSLQIIPSIPLLRVQNNYTVFEVLTVRNARSCSPL